MSAMVVPNTAHSSLPSQPLLRVVIGEDAVIPSWVKDLPSFRAWSCSTDFPDHGRVFYLNGELWVDFRMEQFYWHNQLKEEMVWVLGRLARERKLGRCIPDGMRLVNLAANLSCKPDATFVLRKTIQAGRWRIVDNPDGRQLEMEGTPDMVLEILSDSSVRKDEVVLKQLYAAAGILEYWIVDARRSPLSFEINRLTADGYAPVKPMRDGWRKSKVFGCSFQLVQSTNEFGEPAFTLEVR